MTARNHTRNYTTLTDAILRVDTGMGKSGMNQRWPQFGPVGYQGGDNLIGSGRDVLRHPGLPCICGPKSNHCADAEQRNGNMRGRRSQRAFDWLGFFFAAPKSAPSMRR